MTESETQATETDGRYTSPELTESSPSLLEDTEQEERPSGTLLSGVSASEAGRLSGIARRANRNPEDAVIRALRRRAESGDASAARELRNWLDRQAEERPVKPLEDYTDEERDWLAAKVAAELIALRDENEPRPGSLIRETEDG